MAQSTPYDWLHLALSGAHVKWEMLEPSWGCDWTVEGGRGEVATLGRTTISRGHSLPS